ncbi:MAG TPA: PDDEXK nuclease domain-containing protein [Gammaproteobacteria bacterium]|nr:PDDEXK nuclease domain-containing protein [Gammaproteobacteria bacterium]
MLNKAIVDHKTDFANVYSLIAEAQSRAWQQVNKILIELYWKIGQYVSKKVENSGWGKSVVEQLSHYITTENPSISGFSARNIWRMKQFFETYPDQEKLSALLTEISWTNHLHILSKTKSVDEKQYYLELAAKHRYSERDFARVIDSCTYERTKLADLNLSAVLTEFPKALTGTFKDSYVFEFLGISDNHKESDLRRALVKHLKQFLRELGPDFSLMAEEYPLQVGMKDFRIDLLMFHRGLNCMVAIELKTTEFQPAHLGQLQFYLEVLDQEVKKPHENPSIGILICKTKDEDVVKYAMNRNMSPTMIAEYEIKLLNKSLLQKRLHEVCLVAEEESMSD